MRVTDRPNSSGSVLTSASTNRVFAKGDRNAVICSRPGGLDGEYGAPSFSTLQVYWYEYLLAAFQFHDPENALMKFHLSEQFLEVLAAPESGYCITSILS